MADKRITQLTALTASANDDLLVVVDISENETKKQTKGDFLTDYSTKAQADLLYQPIGGLDRTGTTLSPHTAGDVLNIIASASGQTPIITPGYYGVYAGLSMGYDVNWDTLTGGTGPLYFGGGFVNKNTGDSVYLASQDGTNYAIKATGNSLFTGDLTATGNFTGTDGTYGTQGPEKITNGTFTGDASGWTLGTGWAYSSNTVVKSGDGTGTLTQTSAGMVTPLVPGEVYQFSITMSGWSVGTANVSVGGFTVNYLGANKTYTYTFTASSTATLTFTPTNTSRFTLDSISLKKLSGNLTAYGNIATPGHVHLSNDYSKAYFGASNNASIYYGYEPAGKGVLYINSAEVGSGATYFPGFVAISNNPYQVNWDTNYRLYVVGAYGATYNRGIYAGGYLNASGASAMGLWADAGMGHSSGNASAVGIGGRAYITGAGNATNMYGLQFQTQIYGAGTADTTKGIEVTGGVYNNNTGHLTNGYGINVLWDLGNTGAYATNVWGIRINTPAGDYHLGTITNWYGLWIDDFTATTITRGIVLNSDNLGLELGAGQDAKIYYNGTDLIVNPQVVGSGQVVINSVKTTTGDPTAVEGKIYWNTTDNVIKMYADGAWRTLASW